MSQVMQVMQGRGVRQKFNPDADWAAVIDGEMRNRLGDKWSEEAME
jgi:hypothetical protein